MCAVLTFLYENASMRKMLECKLTMRFDSLTLTARSSRMFRSIQYTDVKKISNDAV